MTDRDRLIELKRQSVNYALEKADERGGLVCIDDEVDYLLANGVIVPPCKVGDTVYLIPTYNGKPYCGITQDKVQMIGITSRGVHIKARNHHDHNKMYMLGKSVFLTKEEAEEKLKECEGNV
jgi:predicted GIY-YIG superfamily endonuclease